jgi:CRP-like cAMP-binding protein
MTSFDVLHRYFEEKVPLTGVPFTDDQLALMRARFVPRTLAAGEFLQRAGDVPRYGAFVAKGCLRSYVIDAKGKEHIVQFAPEAWWLSDTTALSTATPSQYFFEAIEPSDLLLIDPPSHVELVDKVPGYAASFRIGIQRHAAAKDRRIVSTLSTTAEERDLEFLSTYPSIANRVPQWMLASYLGVSPETVSRIRKSRSLTRR